ncbi:ATP-binding protein [Flagellimonas sp. HMM57]|uniref:ATP-dependent nuclease n=1 Tax=unclassified Flagellimonas TaxID=2644544 RepID=UPI0013D5B44D|nr:MULTISPECIES: AAA family ATPase [unclassified Flagellimonas]UII75506.1 ATP-binding protein [Flagellimonas sp. HMM57]
MFEYKIEKIKFKNSFIFKPKNLVVLIGPNNCGKSQVLKDILKITTIEKPDSIVVDDISYSWPSKLSELLDSYNINSIIDNDGNHYIRTLNSSFSGVKNLYIGNDWEDRVEKWLEKKDEQSRKNFSNYFGNFLVNFLSTEDRLKNILQSKSGEVNKQVENLLQAVYKEGTEIEAKLRELVKDSFELDILLDYTNLVNLCFRISKSFGTVPTDPRELRKILEKERRLDEQGDGLKSFISTFLSLHVGQKPVLLLDEPEAFLHPPQALKLGEIIAEQANNKKQIFIATHSVDLLRGILNIRQDIDLIRITRKDDINSISQLNPEEVKKIANDPLLSSTRVLEGLFYKGVVVTEADSDSIFYQRLSRQLFDNDDIHYTHSHNKQTVTKVSMPYFKLKVNHAVIVDFDILRVWDELKRLLEQKNADREIIDKIRELRKGIVSEVESQSPKSILTNLKTEIKDLLDTIKLNVSIDIIESTTVEVRRKLKKIREENSPWSKYKNEGRRQLSVDNQTKFDEINSYCKAIGVFIVPVGELESWLVTKGLPKSSSKSKWIVKALERIPELSAKKTDIPWSFVSEVHNFLKN